MCALLASTYWGLSYRPVFADVRESDCNIDPESIVAAMTPRTRVIVLVH